MAPRRLLCWWGATAVLVVVGAGLAVGSCAPGAGPGGPPAPVPATGSAGPTTRIGLLVGAGSADVGGDAGLLVSDPGGARLAVVPPGQDWRVIPVDVGVSIVGPAGIRSAPSAVLSLVPQDPNRFVRINGRFYRGTVDVLRDRTGLTVVNRVEMEWYLLGVVSAEMGRRSTAEQEALRAQAVVSRTYAVKNALRWANQGFGLYATVTDQVYGGANAETPEGTEAVLATRGQVLTYGGSPIDAFFYSTCGGRTAEGAEVFEGADRPYLHSIPDVGADGIAYCSISPRFRWREEWSEDQLRQTLRRTLPSVGVSPAAVREVSDIRVTSRTESDRVGRLTIGLSASEVRVDGPSIRQVLRPPSGGPLRSTAFVLTVGRAGGVVRRLVADGAGAGHGVGLCQWGAVARSRAGQGYGTILAAYFPGAALQRLY